MKINGTNGANTQMGMNQATGSYSRNIRKQSQELSSNEEMAIRGEDEKATGDTATGRKCKAKSAEAYAKELAKLVPSVEFKVGNSFSTAKSGKTLTVNPRLLEKMQNNPEQAKETKELIRGVESAMNLIDNINRASGWTVVYKHGYIDENGKYRASACLRNDFMLNMSDKLREERRKNSEKLIEKTKEKVEQMLLEKLENSENGEIYLDDDDMQKVIEAAKEQEIKQADKKQGNYANAVGANLDFQI